MPSLRHRLVTAAVAVLALPVAMGPGRCGFISDFTETFLYPEEIDRIVLVTGDGNIDAVAYDRDAVFIRRHSFGFLRDFITPEESLEDGVLNLRVDCAVEDNCFYDHMIEMPLGVAVDITMSEAIIDIGYFDAELTMTFETGSFYGVRLATPELTLTADEADVDADFAVPPTALTIDLDAGEVLLAVPAGAYRCELDAGDVTTDGITCDDAAASVLDVRVGSGTIAVTGVTP